MAGISFAGYLTRWLISLSHESTVHAWLHALHDQRLDETFAALANPTRRAILARLAVGTATVNELAAPFELSLPAISKHIKVLERAGLVRRGHHAQYRPCALDAAPLEQISTWAEQYRPVWEARFDRMDDYLTQSGLIGSSATVAGGR